LQGWRPARTSLAGRASQPIEQLAALKDAGSAPARLMCPALVGREADCTMAAPRRHWKLTTPRSVEAGLPGAGTSVKLRPAWRADPAAPTKTKPLAAPAPRSTQCLVVALRYCRRKLIYIAS